MSLSVDIAGSAYTWRNFVLGAPTAREGQLSRFFFAKMAFHVQTIGEKAKNRTKKRAKNPPKNVFFSILSDQLAEFDLIWLHPNKFERPETKSGTLGAKDEVKQGPKPVQRKLYRIFFLNP